MLDLDGTLLRTDLLVESVLAVVVMRPWKLFHVVAWLLQGKAVLKRPGCRGGDLGENLSCSNYPGADHDGNRPPKVKNRQIRLLQNTQPASPLKGFRILHGRLMNVAGTRTIGTDMLMRYCQGL